MLDTAVELLNHKSDSMYHVLTLWSSNGIDVDPKKIRNVYKFMIENGNNHHNVNEIK